MEEPKMAVDNITRHNKLIYFVKCKYDSGQEHSEIVTEPCLPLVVNGSKIVAIGCYKHDAKPFLPGQILLASGVNANKPFNGKLMAESLEPIEDIDQQLALARDKLEAALLEVTENRKKIDNDRAQISDAKNKLAQDIEKHNRDIEQDTAKLNSKVSELERRESRIEIDEKIITASQEKLDIVLRDLEIREKAMANSLALINQFRPYLENLQEWKSSPTQSTELDNIPIEKAGLKLRDCLYKSYHDPGVVDAFLLSMITAVVVGRFVLLSGCVGVGKTRTVESLSQILGEDASCVVPVRPGWLDPVDLFGFYDPIHERFRPTYFCERVHQASQMDRIRLICLDEMNLARVENYAADLLAKLENGDMNQRSISLFSNANKTDPLPYYVLQNLYKKYEHELGEEQKKAFNIALKSEQWREATLYLGKNLVVCGTLNVDETTEHLSPKMVDRSLILRFPNPELLYNIGDSEDAENQRVLFSASRVCDYINGIDIQPINKWAVICDSLKSFCDCIIPPSYRMVKDYMIFLKVGHWLGLDPEKVERAYMLVRVLPRIRYRKSEHGDMSKNLVEYLAKQTKETDPLADAASLMIKQIERSSYIMFESICG